MQGNEEFIQEDWERENLKDYAYLLESEMDKEHEYWEWYWKQTGTVRVEQPDGSIVEVEQMIDDYKLPF